MSITISVLEKKEFVEWFLNHDQLKKRECIWLLNYLTNDDQLLKNIHFVEHAEYCPKAIIMSTQSSKGIAFQFFKEHVMTTNPEKAFHDIRLQRNEPVYIQLNFKNAMTNPQYVAVLEENPFFPSDVNTKFGLHAEAVLVDSNASFLKQKLLNEIDEALDKNDQVTFQALTEKLNDFYLP